MRSPRALLCSLLFALGLTAPGAMAQATFPSNMNDMPLLSGIDVINFLGVPSRGFPTGTNPPDLANGDFFWKVHPREALFRGGRSEMNVTGFAFELYDTDWTTPPNYYDMIISRGVDSADVALGGSGTNPGNIEPDFGDPNSVFITLGNSGLPTPCVQNPQLCGSNGCPVIAGQIIGYEIEVDFANGAAGAIPVVADGIQDTVISAFAPGGMVASGGACGGGDYTLGFGASDTRVPGGFGEFAPDILGTGYSPFSGFRLGGGAFVADPFDASSKLEMQFLEPTLIVTYTDAGISFFDTGLVGLNVPTGANSPQIRARVFDYEGIGNSIQVLATLAPPILRPGLPLFGDFNEAFMLPFGDPLVQFLLNDFPLRGPATLDNRGGIPFDNGVFDTIPFAVGPVFAGQIMTFQGFRLEATRVVTTNVWTCTLR